MGLGLTGRRTIMTWKTYHMIMLTLIFAAWALAGLALLGARI
jgi:hypothetical protein